jgi:hypothetical protein
MIESVLEECRGRISGPSGAAGKLRMPRSTLESRIKRLRINKHQFKFEGQTGTRRRHILARSRAISPGVANSAAKNEDWSQAHRMGDNRNALIMTLDPDPSL